MDLDSRNVSENEGDEFLSADEGSDNLDQVEPSQEGDAENVDKLGVNVKALQEECTYYLNDCNIINKNTQLILNNGEDLTTLLEDQRNIFDEMIESIYTQYVDSFAEEADETIVESLNTIQDSLEYCSENFLNRYDDLASSASVTDLHHVLVDCLSKLMSAVLACVSINQTLSIRQESVESGDSLLKLLDEYNGYVDSINELNQLEKLSEDDTAKLTECETWSEEVRDLLLEKKQEIVDADVNNVLELGEKVSELNAEQKIASLTALSKRLFDKTSSYALHKSEEVTNKLLKEMKKPELLGISIEDYLKMDTGPFIVREKDSKVSRVPPRKREAGRRPRGRPPGSKNKNTRSTKVKSIKTVKDAEEAIQFQIMRKDIVKKSKLSREKKATLFEEINARIKYLTGLKKKLSN